MIDPQGLTFAPVNGDQESFDKSVAYLKRSPTMAQIIDYLEHYPTLFQVNAGPTLTNEHQYISDTVSWNPTRAFLVPSNTPCGSPGTISPALALAHELIHLAGGFPGFIRSHLPSPMPGAPNQEEFNTTFIEGIVASELGEGRRLTYDGVRPYPGRVVSPVPPLIRRNSPK